MKPKIISFALVMSLGLCSFLSNAEEYTHVLTKAVLGPNGGVKFWTYPDNRIRYHYNLHDADLYLRWAKYQSGTNVIGVVVSGPQVQNATLYIKELTIEWGENVLASNPGASMTITGTNDAAYNEQFPSIIGDVSNPARGETVGTMPVKTTDQISTFIFTKPYHYIGIYQSDNTDMNLNVKSITFVWSTEAPADNSKTQLNLGWQLGNKKINGNYDADAVYEANNTYSIYATDNIGNEISDIASLVNISVDCPNHDSKSNCYEISDRNVKLLHSGNYKLKAELKSNVNYEAASSELDVTVNPLRINLASIGKDFTLPWTNSPSPLFFDYISLIPENATVNSVDINSYLEYGLYPKFDTQNQTGGAQALSDEEKKYLNIFENNNIKYDGLFNQEKLYLQLVSMPNKSQFMYEVPCSGLYELIINSIDSNVVLSTDGIVSNSKNYQLNIYPSLKTFYELDPSISEVSYLGTSVNSYLLSDDLSLTHPTHQEGNNIVLSGNYTNAKLFIPGLYNAQIHYYAEWYGKNRASSRDIPTYQPYSHELGIDLSNLMNSNLRLHVKVLKNGALTPLNDSQESEEVINIIASDVPTNLCTIIDDTEKDIEYFTLDGIKLGFEPSQKGIYIKKTGTSTQKFIRK